MNVVVFSFQVIFCKHSFTHFILISSTQTNFGKLIETRNDRFYDFLASWRSNSLFLFLPLPLPSQLWTLLFYVCFSVPCLQILSITYYSALIAEVIHSILYFTLQGSFQRIKSALPWQKNNNKKSLFAGLWLLCYYAIMHKKFFGSITASNSWKYLCIHYIADRGKK